MDFGPFSQKPLTASIGVDASHVVSIVPPSPSAFSDSAIADYLGALQNVIDASIASDTADAKAKTDAARKQYVGWASSVAGFAGGPAAAKLAGDYAGAVFDAGHWIASTFGPDDLKAANTDEQKGRMRDRVTSMLKRGLPPHGFDAGEEMGARDVADVIEDDLSIIAAVSQHGEGVQISDAISKALLGQGASDARDMVSKRFIELSIVQTATRRTMWGGVSAAYLITQAGKMKPGTSDYQITHPEIEIVAAAFAATRGVVLSSAIASAYAAINSYASRRKFTNANDFLGPAYHPRDPQVTDDVAHWLNLYGRGDSIIDVWNSLSIQYGASGSTGNVGNIPTPIAAGLTVGAGYLAYKFVWPVVKRWF